MNKYRTFLKGVVITYISSIYLSVSNAYDILKEYSHYWTKFIEMEGLKFENLLTPDIIKLEKMDLNR